MIQKFMPAIKTRLNGALVICTLWVLTTPVAAAEATAFPRYFDVLYTMNRQGLDIAEVQLQLKPRPDQGFRYTSRSQTIGIAKLFRDEQITEISDWRFNQGRLQSLRYQYSRSGGKRVREAEAEFDYSKGQIHNTLNGKQWSIPLPDRMYDKLNYTLALMDDLGRGLRLDRYPVADGAKLKAYDLRYLGEERIETPLGLLQTLIMERTVKGDKKVTRVWAAKSLHYMAVKIEHREDGEIITLTLTELKELDGYRPAAVQAPTTD